MKYFTLIGSLVLLLSCAGSRNGSDKGWISLWDGKTFNGWKISGDPSTFTIDSGMIRVFGPRCHLYYDGPVEGHNFKDFEFRARVMTTPGSNSGIFFHTAYKPDGWPVKGHEAQVNQSHTDWRRTGSLYSVDDVKEVYVKDNEWYTEYIKVEGRRIIIKINDRVVVDHTEPEGVEKLPKRADRHLSSGTFALQGHDPKSKVYYKDIQVRPLHK